MRSKTRVAVATAAIVLLSGGTMAAAEASASPSPSTPPGSSSSPSPSAAAGCTGSPSGDAKAGSQQSDLDQMAGRLHVTPARLESALAAAKQSMGARRLSKPDAVVIGLVAKDLGISKAQATALLQQVFGNPGAKGAGQGKKPGVPPGTPDPKISAALAKILGVSQARAAAVLKRLDALAGASGHGIVVTDPGFRSLAASLGLTPNQLSQDLVQMKESLRATMPAPSGSASAKG